MFGLFSRSYSWFNYNKNLFNGKCDAHLPGTVGDGLADALPVTGRWKGKQERVLVTESANIGLGCNLAIVYYYFLQEKTSFSGQYIGYCANLGYFCHSLTVLLLNYHSNYAISSLKRSSHVGYWVSHRMCGLLPFPGNVTHSLFLHRWYRKVSPAFPERKLPADVKIVFV